jgi:hypothetical protein
MEAAATAVARASPMTVRIFCEIKEKEIEKYAIIDTYG